MHTYNENTEGYLIIKMTSPSALPSGPYMIAYSIKDNSSGESFKLKKWITIDSNVR